MGGFNTRQLRLSDAYVYQWIIIQNFILNIFIQGKIIQ